MKKENSNEAISCYHDYGPVLGYDDISIGDNCNEEGSCLITEPSDFHFEILATAEPLGSEDVTRILSPFDNSIKSEYQYVEISLSIGGVSVAFTNLPLIFIYSHSDHEPLIALFEITSILGATELVRCCRNTSLTPIEDFNDNKN